jgi:hypothetical protein
MEIEIIPDPSGEEREVIVKALAEEPETPPLAPWCEPEDDP